MTSTFVAIDVETANPDMASICQIGMAKFTDGKLVEEWVSLIDPEVDFFGKHISVHGIEPHMVAGKPTFPEVVAYLRSFLNGSITVSHTAFDRLAINRASEKYSIQPIETSWLDSSRVVRRTWTDLAQKGYGLSNVCKRIGYEFNNHHDALADAKAAGYVLLAAIQESKHDLTAWPQLVSKPINAAKSSSKPQEQLEANPEGDLYGEVLVFTGSLKMVRAEASRLAAAAGCKVETSVTKRTTMLVVGDQDIARLGGKEKSDKHLKAEKLIFDGFPLRIVQESDFNELVRLIR
jgi:DNA polymerase III subunit epsilon